MHQVIGADLDLRVGAGQRVQLGVGVHEDNRWNLGQAALAHDGVGKQHGLAHAVCDPLQALQRIRAVQGQVQGAGLHDRQDRGNHLDGPLLQHHDRVFWPDAQAEQPAGNPVGPLIELGVGHSLGGGGHRDRVRCPCHYVSKALLNGIGTLHVY